MLIFLILCPTRTSKFTFYPFGYLSKRFFVWNVINYNSNIWISYIRWNQWSKSFLSCCIPQLKSYGLFMHSKSSDHVLTNYSVTETWRFFWFEIIPGRLNASSSIKSLFQSLLGKYCQTNRTWIWKQYHGSFIVVNLTVQFLIDDCYLVISEVFPTWLSPRNTNLNFVRIPIWALIKIKNFHFEKWPNRSPIKIYFTPVDFSGNTSFQGSQWSETSYGLIHYGFPNCP